VYLISEGDDLPEEKNQLVIAITGPRELPTWLGADTTPMDFFDLKGIVDVMLEQLKLENWEYRAVEHPSLHPGKTARIRIEGESAGVIGEIHPMVHERYEFVDNPVLVAEINLDRILMHMPYAVRTKTVATYPPVLEDLAIVVEEKVTAKEIEDVLWKAGGKLLVDVQLFDLYRGEQIQHGMKSLAYALTYQAPDRTLTDNEVAKLRARILKQLDNVLGAKLRE
jgi:phenylalanyl-tRNA synthetase beta chain